jgi:magnesium-transporting ATPase (P-type)
MVLGRIITFLRGENLSFVPVKLMTKIFVGGDVLSFILQAAGKRISYDLHGIFKTLIAILFAGGGVMTSGSRSSLEIGQWVIVAGLCVQLIFFGAFVLSALVFHYNITRTPTSESERTMSPAKLSWSRDWRGPLSACYIVSVLIVIRSIYRLVEFVQGNDGFVISHEVFLYVFDAAMMFIAMVVMNLFHPSAVLQGGTSVHSEHKNDYSLSPQPEA